jgi:protein subunit release factor A
MMKRHLEIKATEGGRDAQLFVHDLATAYRRLADRVG